MVWDVWSAFGWVLIGLYVVVYFERREKKMFMSQLNEYQEQLKNYDRLINQELKFLALKGKESDMWKWKELKQLIESSQLLNMVYDEIGITEKNMIDYINEDYIKQLELLIHY